MTERRRSSSRPCERNDPDERPAYLDEACAGQPELRQQVENLLRLHRRRGSFLEKPAAESAATGPFGCRRPAVVAEAPARSSARTSCSSRSAKAAWARSGWPSRPSRSSGWWR